MRNSIVMMVSSILLFGCAEERKICAPDYLIEEIKSIRVENPSVISYQVIEELSGFKFISPVDGGAFGAKKGDYLIQNDRIRIIIQQRSRQISPTPYGGNIIDGDVIREEGVWHDIIGEISPFIGLSYTMDPEEFEIIRDGSDGVFAMRIGGRSELLDYINLQSAVTQLAPSVQINLPWDLNTGIPVEISTFYVLKSGDYHLDVYTAVCNTSNEKIATALGDIIDSGGMVSYYNRDMVVDGIPGFGYTGDPLHDLQPASMISFMGEDSGYAIVPDEPAMNLIISGVAVIQYGTSEGLSFLLSALNGFSVDNPPEGYYPLEGGKSVAYKRSVIIYDTFDTLMREYYAIKGITSTGTVSGTCVVNGQLVSNVRIAFVNNDKLENLLVCDENGHFEGVLQEGTYTVYANLEGYPQPEPQLISIRAGENTQFDIQIPPPAYLRFDIKGIDPNISSQPESMPAKISLVCKGTCPRTEKRLFTDTLYDKFPPNVQIQAFVDNEGKVSVMAKRGWRRMDNLPVFPGEYTVVISRGMEFSIHTQSITLSPGEEKVISATITRVVDTSGYISADLHVHSVNSPDAPVPLLDRVITFMGEGVEVLVSTDHDFITDYTPVIASINAEKFLISFPGEELTTFDVGHFNGYPLRVSETAYQNGAVDWAGGRGPTLTPQEIIQSLKDIGAIDNPIVQVNHPRSPLAGYFTAIKLDTDTLKTHTDPQIFRMDPSMLNVTSDDTGLFSDLFDAFEIYNSYDEITPVLNDYFTFLNIGFVRTGVAASDTHHWYSSEAGVPRSFIHVGEGYDTPDTMTPEKFVESIREGRVVGTNGPFIHFWLEKPGDPTKYLMGDLVQNASSVILHVEIRMPEWITVDTLEVFSNTKGTASKDGVPVKTWPQPFIKINLNQSDFTVSNGQKLYSYSYTLENLSEDAWFVIIVRDDPDYGDNYPMTPVLYNEDELPFAFTNAVFVDVDGNGVYNPPGATLASSVAQIVKEERLITKEEIKKILKEVQKISH